MAANEEDKVDQAKVAVLKTMSETNWPLMQAVFEHEAKRASIKFVALTKVGFNEKQALQLCIRVWE